MSYIPATLRRSGYDQVSSPGRFQGFCGLSPHDQHTLTAFVSGQPARVLAEFIIEIASERLEIDETLRRAASWRDELSPAKLQATGGDRFPSRALRLLP